MKFPATLTGVFFLFASCSSPVTVPSIEKILPGEVRSHQTSESSRALDFNLDGTLSMQGFVRPSEEKFSQLLQDLDLSFTALWKPAEISYHRFGSVVETIAQRPFYVVASNASFFKSTKEYSTTRIDNVFKASKPGHLTVVMTDLFEQDLDISSIQQSLKAASFPERASLAIWQWSLPFAGSIFDFDFRTHGGRNYIGGRYLYMLALGSNESILKLRDSIDRNITIGKPQFLLLSNKPVKTTPWLNVTQIRNAALKSRSTEAPGALPYSVYRTSRGCNTAEWTARPQLMPAAAGAPELAVPGTYKASLDTLIDNKGTWSQRRLTDPNVHSTIDSSGHELLKIEVKCADVVGPNPALLRIGREGTGNDLVLPPWIAASSATSTELKSVVKDPRADWGQKTLNLLPLVRGLANTATDGVSIAITYIYLVAS